MPEERKRNVAIILGGAGIILLLLFFVLNKARAAIKMATSGTQPGAPIPGTPGTVDIGNMPPPSPEVQALSAGFKLKRYLAVSTVAGQCFVDIPFADRIPEGYYRFILHASGYYQTSGNFAGGFYLVPEGDRAILPSIAAGAVLPRQATGVLVSAGGVGIVSTTTITPMENQMAACFVERKIIPYGYFYRFQTHATNNTPASGTTIEMRIIYADVPIDFLPRAEQEDKPSVSGGLTKWVSTLRGR